MSFLDFLYRVIIYPLELLFEVVFQISESHFHDAGKSIIILSLFVNFLVLPMYARADAMQAEERDKEKALDRWSKHIRATFKGDERFMMLQTYYRQEDYKQTYVLRSSIPLLLQVPFFMAAYNFLSNLKYLNGASIGPITDLSSPDHLLPVAGHLINILPLLMTGINIVSGMIYSKGFPLKTKIQMYGIALVFLVLLYRSPAGLVFYWTLNNVFSLCKNIVVAIYTRLNLKEKLPKIKKVDFSSKADTPLFAVAALAVTGYVGLNLPLEAIAACPQEYIDLHHYFNPLILVLYTFATALGIFVVWFGVFYYLAKKNTKAIYALVTTMIAVVGIFNSITIDYAPYLMNQYFVFGKEFKFTQKETMLNLLFIAIICAVIFVIWLKKRKVLTYVLLTALIAMSVMCIKNYNESNKELKNVYFQTENYMVPANMTLSRNGQNVVVIMLDRAIGAYYPYIMENNERLANEFEGFTYYPNTISYGQNTIFGVPSLFGGADYTVEQMNLRNDETMRDKLDEALLMMPRLFSENGYDVTVVDPSYAGYMWIPDLSIYDEYENVNAYYSRGAYTPTEMGNFENRTEALASRQIRNMFCYSVQRCMPVRAAHFFYDEGNYHAIEYGPCSLNETRDVAKTLFDNLYTLQHMQDMTHIVDDDSNNLILFSNETTHNPAPLLNGTELFPDGCSLDLSGSYINQTYQINIMGYDVVGRWLDYLRAEGVYDNTRIIIVSDHGYYLHHFDNWQTEEGVDLMAINSVLLVKDFGDTEYAVNDDFMTIAAVPYFATNGVIDNPVNPFTGNPINLDFLNDDQVIIISTNKMPHDNPGNQYANGDWYIISGETYDEFELEPIAVPGT